MTTSRQQLNPLAYLVAKLAEMEAVAEQWKARALELEKRQDDEACE